MKMIIGVLNLVKNCFQAFFSSLKHVITKKDCFWTFNETFFTGENAKQRRNNFQLDYNELVEQHKTK